MLLKRTGNRYYKYNWEMMRSFPIKKADAEALIDSGEAELVECFPNNPEFYETYTEEVQEVRNDEMELESEVEVKREDAEENNVIDFNSKLEAKKEEKEVWEFAQSIVEVIPLLRYDEKTELLKSLDERNPVAFQKVVHPYLIRRKMLQIN